jgi:hypothetical protein
MSPAEQYAPSDRDIMERATGFSGREWVFERIHDWLRNPAGGRFYLMTAEPGAGKTAIAARLVQFSRGRTVPPASCPLFQPGFVSAAHFCSANVGSWIDPMGFARSVSLQLARSHPGFASMLVHTGERSVNIQVVQNVEKADKVSGVVIENLVLTGLSPQATFNSTFTDTLINALSVGDTTPITIVVDALDEALAFKGDVNILTLLSSLNKLPVNVRFLLTSRPDARVGAVFPEAAGFVMSAADNDDANARDIRGFLDTRLPDHPQRAEVVDEIVAKAERNFQYVTFLLKQMMAGSAPQLSGLPVGLHPLYRESLARVIRLDAWRQKYAPIMGILLGSSRGAFGGTIALVLQAARAGRVGRPGRSRAVYRRDGISGRLPSLPSISRRFSPGEGSEVAGWSEEPVLSAVRGVASRDCRVLHARRPNIVVTVGSLRFAIRGIAPCPRCGR